MFSTVASVTEYEIKQMDRKKWKTLIKRNIQESSGKEAKTECEG